MIGNSWSMAQLSGSDWNSEKLQKYVSESDSSRSSSSSGISSSRRAASRTLVQVDQYSRSASARNSSDSSPSLNICNAWSRAVSAS